MLPGEDVRAVLTKWAVDHSVKAASVLSAVGSLKQASLRYAGEPTATVLQGPFEIVSLSGMLAASGVHLHVAIADKVGKSLGGHLDEGSLVHTTLEIAIGVYFGVEMLRQNDARTGYNELFLQGCR